MKRLRKLMLLVIVTITISTGLLGFFVTESHAHGFSRESLNWRNGSDSAYSKSSYWWDSSDWRERLKKYKEDKSDSGSKNIVGNSNDQNTNLDNGSSNQNGIQPYAGAPSCLDLGMEHDLTAYHGVWDYANGCYWDHTHNADPSSLNSKFGSWPFSNLISYPHQTLHENTMKHAGYKWYTFDTNGECVEERDVIGAEGCVTAMRLQYHVVGSEMGVKTRFHSYYGQVEIKNPDGTLGKVSTGGHADFGVLHNPYKTVHCALDSDPSSFNISQPPYRALDRAIGVTTWNGGINGINRFDGYNRILRYDWIDYDTWTHESSCASYSDEALEFICSDLERCDNNHSRTRFYEVVVQIPPELRNGSAKVSYTGFTDLAGNVDTSCVEASENCVPLKIENVDPTTDHVFRVSIGGAANNPAAFPVDEYAIDFDVSPMGTYWIRYPN